VHEEGTVSDAGLACNPKKKESEVRSTGVRMGEEKTGDERLESGVGLGLVILTPSQTSVFSLRNPVVFGTS